MPASMSFAANATKAATPTAPAAWRPVFGVRSERNDSAKAEGKALARDLPPVPLGSHGRSSAPYGFTPTGSSTVRTGRML